MAIACAHCEDDHINDAKELVRWSEEIGVPHAAAPRLGATSVFVDLHPLNRATIRLVAVVSAWWLLLLGVIALSAPPSMGADETPVVSPGHVGHVATPSGEAWLIPVDRATYYEVERPPSDEDDDVQADARSRPGWLPVIDGQTVRVIDVDRAAVQVELLEEPNVGGQGWLHLNYLRP